MAIFTKQQVAVEFPMDQSCCGLPVQMMGEIAAAKQVAARNVIALDVDRVDYIVTLCASCASHLKKSYPVLLARRPSLALKAGRMADKVIAFSSFCYDVLQLQARDFEPGGPKVTYHAPCHLCRGLNVRKAPHGMFEKAGLDFAPALEEETCCGFGGTYSTQFPAISAEILRKKLDDIEKTHAECLITECPGCILQLRGGAARRGMNLRVQHLSEVLMARLKGK